MTCPYVGPGYILVPGIHEKYIDFSISYGKIPEDMLLFPGQTLQGTLPGVT